MTGARLCLAEQELVGAAWSQSRQNFLARGSRKTKRAEFVGWTGSLNCSEQSALASGLATNCQTSDRTDRR